MCFVEPEPMDRRSLFSAHHFAVLTDEHQLQPKLSPK